MSCTVSGTTLTCDCLPLILSSQSQCLTVWAHVAHFRPTGGHFSGLQGAEPVVLLLGCCPPTASSTSPDVLARLLVAPPCSRCYANRHNIPSCHSWRWFASPALTEPLVLVVDSTCGQHLQQDSLIGVADCQSFSPVICSVCTTACGTDCQWVVLPPNWTVWFHRSVIELALQMFPYFFWAPYIVNSTEMVQGWLWEHL